MRKGLRIFLLKVIQHKRVKFFCMFIKAYCILSISKLLRIISYPRIQFFLNK